MLMDFGHRINLIITYVCTLLKTNPKIDNTTEKHTMPPSGPTPLDGMNADEIMKLFNNLRMGTMMEQSELRAREAASKRTEDPLKNWARPPSQFVYSLFPSVKKK